MKKKLTYEELEKKVQKLEHAEANRKQCEEQVTHTHELLNYIISHARSSIVLFDKDLKYKYVSKRYLEEYKLKKKNVIGKHHYEVLPDIPQKWRDVHQRSLAGEVLSAKEDPYYKEDGSVNWTTWECRPWYEADGLIGGIIIYTEVINERREVDESLRKSEQLLATHLQNTPIGAISWDLDFKIVDWNPAAENIFGYTKKEAMGKYPTQIIISEDIKEDMDDLFQDLIFEKGGTRSTNKNRTKDGRQIICDWYNTTLIDSEGKAIGVASLVQDITERVKAVDALKKQKKFSEKIIQTSNALIVGLNENHKIVLFNQGAEKITGFSSREVIGRDWFEIFFNPDIYDEMDRVWKSAWGAKYISYVNPIQAKNGDEKIISWQITGMYDSADEAKHMMLSIGEDITERKKADETLRQYEHIISASNDHMSFLDRDYTYLAVNDAYIIAHKKEHSLIVGHPVADTLGDDVFEQVVKEKLDCCLAGEEIHYQHWFDFPGQGRRYMDVSYYPYTEPDETISGVVVSSHDITERKQAEEQIAASLKEKEVLLREIHHRVKNNMQVIVSLLRMYGRKTKDVHLGKVFEDCRDRIMAMSLIHESLYQSDDLAKIDFKDYLEKLCRNLNNAYGTSSKGISLAMGECDVALDMDQGIAIGMVIAELVSNAFKHAFPTGKRGHVSINLSELDAENVKLIIKDDGKGMPAKIDIMNSPSLGLRLAVAAVTRELCGSIEIDRDKGTQFTICFKYK